MSWVFKVFFGIDIRVAKEIFRFRLTKFHINFNFFVTSANSHTFTTPACGCFKDNRITYTISKLLNFLNSFNNTSSRSNRNIIFYHSFTGSSLIAHFAHCFTTRADKFYTLFFTNFGKIGTLRHKTVTRVNCIST